MPEIFKMFHNGARKQEPHISINNNNNINLFEQTTDLTVVSLLKYQLVKLNQTPTASGSQLTQALS